VDRIEILNQRLLRAERTIRKLEADVGAQADMLELLGAMGADIAALRRELEWFQSEVNQLKPIGERATEPPPQIYPPENDQ